MITKCLLCSGNLVYLGGGEDYIDEIYVCESCGNDYYKREMISLARKGVL